MKLGITLRKLDEKLVTRFDLVLFPIRQVTGQTRPANANEKVRPVISCFGHTPIASKFPNWVAVSEDGLPALPGKRNLRDGFAWGWICPNVDEYRNELLQFVKQAARENWDGLHLDSVQFPEANYCHCHRCKAKFAQSGISDWHEWRVSVITDWVATAAKEAGKHLSLTIHPDPYFLRERFGIDLNSLKPYLEWCMVPLYCLTYDLTYWLDTFLYAFVRLSPVPVFVELYAVEPPAVGVLKALATVSKFPVAGVIFYDPYGKKVSELAKILREDKNVRELVASHPNRNFRELAERIAEWR
jgi:choline dehydrogenase-like flavoprotein